MKFFKNRLLKKSMRMLGVLTLFLSPIILHPTCFGGFYQPKCPDELLR